MSFVEHSALPIARRQLSFSLSPHLSLHISAVVHNNVFLQEIASLFPWRPSPGNVRVQYGRTHLTVGASSPSFAAAEHHLLESTRRVRAHPVEPRSPPETEGRNIGVPEHWVAARVSGCWGARRARGRLRTGSPGGRSGARGTRHWTLGHWGAGTLGGARKALCRLLLTLHVAKTWAGESLHTQRGLWCGRKKKVQGKFDLLVLGRRTCPQTTLTSEFPL